MPYRLAIAQDNDKGWVEGLEPSASRATIWRASQLRHTHHIDKNVPEGIRTPDPRLRRPLLYPAELRTHKDHLLDNLKAGDGNRTHISSLEGWCSTTELHPHTVTIVKYIFETATVLYKVLISLSSSFI